MSLWEIRRVFQELWKGGEAGFPQPVRVTAFVVMQLLSDSARGVQGAGYVDEIVSENQHSDAMTYDGLSPKDDRPPLEIEEFMNRFETSSGRNIAELSSRRRTDDLIRGRVELTLLAVGQYGFQSAVVAKLIDKDRSSLTRWLNLGLRLHREDHTFRDRIDDLDRQIGQQTSTMQQ